jgi:hypothetical protein
MTSVTYTPPPSLIPFFLDESFVDLVVGPVGSGKTSAGILKVAYHAKRMAPCTDGIRRSRAVWVRNTREQLRDSSIKDFLKWFPDGEAGIFIKTEYAFTLRFDDVECEVLFRGLDDANDVRRLLSLQASFAIVEEFREIHPDIFQALQSRLGRYPDGMMVPHRPEWGLDDKGNEIRGCVTDDGKVNSHLWGMSNPPDLETFWEKFLSDPPKNAAVYFQPSGLSVEADWIHHLPVDYYENMAEGKSEDWIDVNIHGKFGKSLSGQAVFGSFDRDFHVAKEALRVIRTDSHPIIIGMDFGLNPSATLCQMDIQGRLLVHDALTSDNMGVTRFLTTKLKPLLASEKYAGAPIVVVGDPAGVQRAQTDEKTVFEILRTQGFRAVPAKTNNIVARISAVDRFLSRQVEGGPGFLISPSATPLIAAMRGGYRYKRKKSGQMEDTPEKNEHSHIADSLQYACLHADGNLTGDIFVTRRRDVVVKSAVGWT